MIKFLNKRVFPNYKTGRIGDTTGFRLKNPPFFLSLEHIDMIYDSKIGVDMLQTTDNPNIPLFLLC